MKFKLARIDVFFLNPLVFFGKYRFERKSDEVNKDDQWIAERKHIDIPMKIFYTSDLPYRMVDWCRELSEEIKETVSMLEDAKILSD